MKCPAADAICNMEEHGLNIIPVVYVIVRNPTLYHTVVRLYFHSHVYNITLLVHVLQC